MRGDHDRPRARGPAARARRNRGLADAARAGRGGLCARAGACFAAASRASRPALGFAGRAPTTGRSAFRGRARELPLARSRCSTRPSSRRARAPRGAGRVRLGGGYRRIDRRGGEAAFAARTAAHPRGDLETYDVGHARALALMRRGRFSDSYAPSIAAGEAVGRAGRPDLAYGCWANAAGAAARCRRPRACARIHRPRYGGARGQGPPEPRGSPARRARVHPDSHRRASTRPAPRAKPSKGSPTSSRSPSCSRWRAMIVVASRSRPGQPRARGAAARLSARGGCTDQSTADPSRARRSVRPHRPDSSAPRPSFARPCSSPSVLATSPTRSSRGSPVSRGCSRSPTATRELRRAPPAGVDRRLGAAARPRQSRPRA